MGRRDRPSSSHITDIAGGGRGPPSAGRYFLAVRPRFGAVKGFRFDGLGQDVPFFKEHCYGRPVPPPK